MKSRAAIAWEAGKPLEVDMVDLEGPKTGEVLIETLPPESVTQTHSRFPETIRKAFFPPSLDTKVEQLLKK